MRNAISMALGLAAAVAALLVAIAGPALAAGSPVSVNAVVGESVTITGLTGTVSFPATVPGQTAAITGAEAYTVGTNDQAGYTLTTTAGQPAFTDGGSGATIPDSAWVVTETGAHTNAYNPTTSGFTVGTTTGAGSDSYSENWSLAIPSGQVAGSYTNSLTYLAIGN